MGSGMEEGLESLDVSRPFTVYAWHGGIFFVTGL